MIFTPGPPTLGRVGTKPADVRAAGYRLRQAELLFQNERAGDADLMMRGVVRKNPTYAGTQQRCRKRVPDTPACMRSTGARLRF